jgi:hypothetical protein
LMSRFLSKAQTRPAWGGPRQRETSALLPSVVVL